MSHQGSPQKNLGFPCGSAGKEFAHNSGDLGLIPGLGRSPGEGQGYPLQYSGLENSVDCIVHGVKESDTTERLFLYERSLKLYTCYGKVSWMMYFLNRRLGDRFCPRAPGSCELFFRGCLGDVAATCLWLQNGRSRLPVTTCILLGNHLLELVGAPRPACGPHSINSGGF